MAAAFKLKSRSRKQRQPLSVSHRSFLACAALLVASAGASAAALGIEVVGGWAAVVPAEPADSAEVFMTIENHGIAGDILLGGDSDLAQRVELEGPWVTNGLEAMRDVESWPVPPGMHEKLQPGGVHLLLTGLKQPLRPGQLFTVTLQFAKAGRVQVPIIAGSSPPQ